MDQVGRFQVDPQNPDPGRVTVRRLNRVEYRNTIRDLLGVDFDTDKEFPPDDAGHGFDNIGDVLTLPPDAAGKISGGRENRRDEGRARGATSAGGESPSRAAVSAGWALIQPDESQCHGGVTR